MGYVGSALTTTLLRAYGGTGMPLAGACASASQIGALLWLLLRAPWLGHCTAMPIGPESTSMIRTGQRATGQAGQSGGCPSSRQLTTG